MADLSTHYKERTPEQTIEIIQQFFKDKGFILKESDINQTEAGTWYNHVDIFQGDVLIGGANGKGVSREYARASGHAELYERFCNNMFFLANPYWNKTFMDAVEDRGYYFDKNEKFLTEDELYHSCKHAEKWLSFFSGNNPLLLSTMLKYITNGKGIGVPAKTLDGEIGLYIDPRLLIRLTHSIGMSAGNTVNEALVQGLSELVEKEAFNQFLQNMGGSYTAINIDKITDPVLRPIIDNIQKIGYKLYLIDLSCNFNVPTLMSILIDENKGLLNINFGSFPVFEIAAERVLTELYQGIKSYKSAFHLGKVQKPNKIVENRELYIIYGNSIDGTVFNYDFFKNLKYSDTYNHDVFVDRKVSNEELVKYYHNLEQKLNIKFYYLDNSQSPDIKAIYSFIDGDNVFNNTEGYYEMKNPIDMEKARRSLIRLMELQDNIYNKTEVDYAALSDLVLNEFNTSEEVSNCIGETAVWNKVHINIIAIMNYDFLRVLFDITKQQYTNIEIPFLYGTIFLVPYRKYIQLIYYKVTQKYDDDELYYIFNDIYHYNITHEDIYKCLSFSYLLKKVYVEPLMNYINSEDYNNIIKAYINSSD